MAKDWDKLMLRMDELIRSGKSAIVVSEFERLRREPVPRQYLSRLAHLSYRVHMPQFGLRLLNPVVREERKKIGNATDLEKSEYAFGLTRIGAEDEALEILKDIDKAKCNRAGYYEATAFIGRWEYGRSIPLFEAYISSLDEESYDRIVAEMNLAAAYVYEHMKEKAEDLIEKILDLSGKKKFFFAVGKALQLKAENLLYQKRWQEIDPVLDEAARRFKITAGLDPFFVKKLRLQKDFESSARTIENLQDFVDFREEARQTGHFESVRDCDRLIALYTKNDEKLLEVYFGTPFPAYRERLLKEYGNELQIPEYWDRNLKGESAKEPLLDLRETDYGKGKNAFLRGSLLHRLLVALTRDSYRPIRIASLHHQLYPGEYYNPVSSPLRVHRAISRLRNWVKAVNLPLIVEENGEFYSLSSKKDAKIRISSPNTVTESLPIPIQKLKAHWPTKLFSVSEASEFLGIPIRTLSRQLNECAEKNELFRVGNGRGTRFTFEADASLAKVV